MKKIILLQLLVSSLMFNAFAGTYSYESLLSKLEACHDTLEGCSTEQQVQIAKFKGIFLNAGELNEYIAQDTQKSVFIPLELTNNELLTLAAATSLGVVAFNNDQEIMDVIQSNKSEVTRPIADVGNFLGSRVAGPSIAAGSYFLGVVFKDNKLKRAGLFMISSSLATATVVTATKEVFGRSRPNTLRGPYDFFNGGKSFYSGHSTQAFTLATVIAELYKNENPVVPYVAYGIASITAYARMHDHAHWASDVIVGAIAGHLITKLTMNMLDGNTDGRGGLLIYPGVDPKRGTYSLMIEWRGKQKKEIMACSRMPQGSLKIEACLREAMR